MATTITGEDIVTGSGFDSSYQGSSRPMFAVEQTNVVTGDVGNYNVIKVNNGNHFDATSGRFTAPVSGIYTFNVRGGNSGAYKYWLYSGTNGALGTQENLQSEFSWESFSLTVYLEANEYVYVTVSNGSCYFGGSGQGGFSGALIGEL
jgi:hypothetical protein